MRTFFSRGMVGLIVFFGCGFFFQPVLAVTYNLVDLDVTQLNGGTDTCDNAEDTTECPGMCAVVIKVASREGFLDFNYDHFYRFNVYKKQDDRSLLKLQKVGVTTQEEATLLLNFSSSAKGVSCGLHIDGQSTTIVDGQSSAVEDLASFIQPVKGSALGEALAKPAYCCCKPSDDGKGNLTDCKAAHDWKVRYASDFTKGGVFTDGVKDATASCGTGYQVQALKKGLENGKEVTGCKFYEGDAAAADRVKKEAEEAFPGSLSDIQTKATELNKLPQFNNVKDANLGAAIIGNFIGLPLGILLGTVTLTLYIIAGFIWMTAAGNSEKSQQAQQMVVWTSFGVVAMLASYILVKFVFQILTGGA